MSRPNNNDTDDYIAALTGSSPKKKGSTLQDEEMAGAADGWTSSSYARLRDNREKSQGHNCSSIIVMAFSVLLFLIGVGVIVIAAIEKDQKLLPICPKCDQTLVYLYIAGGAIILVALVGAAAAKIRKKIIAIPNIIFLFILAIALLGASIAIIVFSTGNGLGIKNAWIHDVMDAPSDVCDLQNELQCSGFELGCCYGPDFNSTTTTTTTAPMTTTASNSSSTNSSSTSTSANTTTTMSTTTTTTTTTTTAALSSGNGSTTGSNTTTTTSASTTSAPSTDFCYTIQNGVAPDWVAKVCVPGCSANIYAHTCDSALRDKIKSNLGAILGGTIPLALIMLLVAALSWRMTKTVADVYE